MNDLITTTAAIEFTGSADGKPPAIRIAAYTGAEMSLGFGSTFVFALDGLENAGTVPLLVDHENTLDKLVGSGVTSIDEKGLTINGSITAKNAAAEQVAGHLQSGTPLQASIGAQLLASKDYRDGEKVNANGRTHTAGPRGLKLVTKWRLREVSILALGADHQTSVIRAAHRGGKVDPMETFETWLAMCGIDSATLTADRRSRLEAAHSAKYPNETAASMDVVERFLSREPELLAAAIEGGWSEKKVKAEALTALRARMPQHITPMNPGRGGSHTTADHIAAAVMVRAGYHDAAEKAYGPNVMEQSRRLHSASFIDIVSAALKADGRDVVGMTNNEMIRAGFSGGSLSVALNGSANKLLEMSYMYAPATWRSFCTIKTAKNFKEQTGVRPTFAGDLEVLPRGGGIQHGSFSEETYTWKVKTFAKMYKVDRQDIVDDDLQIFSEIIPGLGRAAARSLADLVYETLLANAGSFFSVGNGNLSTGGGSALATAGLATAVKKMRIQKDSDGNDLDIAPAVLLVGPTNEVTARGLLQSAEIARSTASDGQLPTGNTFQNFAKLEVESRLENSEFTGYSTTAWYLFGGPNDNPVTVGFLNGSQTPTVEAFGFDAEPDRLAASFRVYQDYGCALGDYRAAQMNTGA